MWAVVPIKQFAIAKMRLAVMLSDAERVALAEAMLQDVLAALNTSRGVERTVIVSKEPAAARLAADFGADYLLESANELSLAVAQGGQYVAMQGGASILSVPGDVPLVTAAEIDEIVALHTAAGGLTLVSDRDGNGTNGLAVSPIDLIEFSYGIDSFHSHAQSGRAAGAVVNTLELEGLSLDIDTPEDVRCLTGYERPSVTLDYLDEIDVVSRLPRRHNVGHAVLG